MSLNDDKFLKGEHGEPLYWANPKINPYTVVRLDFCSAEHSTKWMVEQIEARKDVTPDNDQTAG
jgi:hypothetical protein